MAEIQKLPKNSEKRDKSNFFSFIFPILLSFISRPSLGIVLCANQKLEPKTRITRVTLLWMILDALFEIRGKFVFYPKKDRQFHRWNLHISLYRLFIAFIQCILSSSDREIPTAAAFAVVLNMSSSGHRTEVVGRRTEANVYVVRRRSLRFSDNSE